MRTAVITARGGSKRIPRKNVKDFLGKPIIGYAIGTALDSGLFDKVVVSTDDDEIADVSRRFGAEAPFRRPPELSGDDASTDSVLLHSVRECNRLYGKMDEGCCIYPTSPFLTARDLERGLNMLVQHAATSAFPIVKYDFPIEQAFALEGPYPRAKWPDKLMVHSQDLQDHYHDAGMFYWFDVEKFLQAGELFGSNAVAFEIPSDRCQDINTPEDWKRAEIKFRVLASLTNR